MFFDYHGSKIYYEAVGESNCPVLFLHGWGSSTQGFAFAAKELESSGIAYINLDFLGFGKSDEPPAPYAIKDYAQSVVALLESLKVERVKIVAHSFGARIAILMAAFYPQLVNRLMLTGAAGLKPRRGIRYYMKVRAFKRAKARGKDTSRFGSTDFKALNGVMRQTFVKVVNSSIKMFLSAVKCDTILVWGKRDTQTPMYMARKMARGIKNSALIVFEDSGHFAYVEEGARFNAIMKSFVREYD